MEIIFNIILKVQNKNKKFTIPINTGGSWRVDWHIYWGLWSLNNLSILYIDKPNLCLSFNCLKVMEYFFEHVKNLLKFWILESGLL